ncbi:hypothetical protein ACOL3H_07010 [Aliarcobacter butzleri]
MNKEVRKLSIFLNKEDYSELLAKLANELESYGEEAPASLKKNFCKILKSNLFDNYYRTKLVDKFEEKLCKNGLLNQIQDLLFLREEYENFDLFNQDSIKLAISEKFETPELIRPERIKNIYNKTNEIEEKFYQIIGNLNSEFEYKKHFHEMMLFISNINKN